MTKKTASKKVDMPKTSQKSAYDSGEENQVKESLDKIEAKNSETKSFLEIFKEPVFNPEKQNKETLSGIHVAVKDNILVKGQIASAGSKILQNHKAVYDSTAVKKLKDAGAIIVGRTNMDEFGMGSSTEHSAFFSTKNPVDLTRVPGGSSGGSAAAVASGQVPIALGSDTGGSIRQPASFCGVVGLKPSYGAVSRHGLIALGSSLDHIGPITKTVADAEKVFETIKGRDPRDATTLSDSVYTDEKESDGVKTVGVPRSLIEQAGVSQEVLDNFSKAIENLKEIGYEIKDVSLPSVHYALSVYYIILPAEASSNLARFDGVRYGLKEDGTDLLENYVKTRGEGFGAEVKRRVILGTYVLSSGYYDAYYRTARALRRKISQEFSKTFQSVDVIATPTTPTTAFKLGEKSADPLAMYMSDIFTVPANVSGVPAISVPSGFGESGLPIGLQFMAPIAREDRLFEVGKRYLVE